MYTTDIKLDAQGRSTLRTFFLNLISLIRLRSSDRL